MESRYLRLACHMHSCGQQRNAQQRERHVVSLFCLSQVLELVAEVLRSCRLASPGEGALADGHAFPVVIGCDSSEGDKGGGGGGQDGGGSSSSIGTVVSRALCAHYGVRCVEAMGHGPMGRLLALATQTHATPPLGWHSAVALAPLTATAASFSTATASMAAADADAGLGTGAVGALGCLGREAALAALRAAPELSDLRMSSQWTLVFQSELGPLEDFLRVEGAAAGMCEVEGEGNVVLESRRTSMKSTAP